MISFRVVLAARIPYFRARFDSGLFSSLDQITLDTIKDSVLQLVIGYCYKGTIHLDRWEEVCKILIAADYLQLETLKEECEIILRKELCVENCVELCNLSNTYSCALLKEKATEFAGVHWSHVTEHSTWINLNKSTLQELVLMDQLNTSDEESVLRAVLAWTKHDQKREAHLSTVLTEVRLPLLSTETLAALEQESCVVNSKGCQRLLSEARDYREILSAEKEAGNSNKSKRFKLRERAYFGNSIYVLGMGEDGEGINEGINCDSFFEVYSGVYKEWSEDRSKGWVPATFDNAVVVVNQVIYVLNEVTHITVRVGRKNKYHRRAFFCSYDPSTQRWGLENNGKLPFGTYGNNNSQVDQTAATAVNDCILMAGGIASEPEVYSDDELDDHVYQLPARKEEPLKCAFMYSTITKEWKEVKDMNVGKFEHRMATLHGKAYAIGGRVIDESSYRPIDNEVYDPIVNEWHCIAQMKEGRSSPALVATDSRLAVFGGVLEPDSTGIYTSEWFDPRVGHWQSGVDMPVHSACMAATMLGDEVYLIGGEAVDGQVKQIYVLDQRTEKWRKGPVLRMGRQPCYAVTIH